jgi:two-component system sensor histidine kinase AlgZ
MPILIGMSKLLISKSPIKSVIASWLDEWVNTAKSVIIDSCKSNIVSIIVSIIICIGLTIFMEEAHTRAERVTIATAYLAIDYWLLFLLVLCKSGYLNQSININKHSALAKYQRIKNSAINWFNRHNIAISFVMAFTSLHIFQETHDITLINNLTIALGYALLLFHVVVYLQNKLKDKTQNFNLESQKIYFIYAFCIALSFFFATTVDHSERYGTHFQLIILSWLMLLHLITSWVMGQWKLVKQLKNERTSAELMHLKSQVNPHFLFNTLNNVYGLAREKSDETPALILKLSDMLRYTIYQGKKDRVHLSEEITYLEDFIQLQQVRYHKTVKIDFKHPLNQVNLTISPLLLIILLENAYKHGVEKLTHDAFVDINIQVECQHLTFEIRNNFDPEQVSDTPGIGLNNLKRRLSLIYPNAHQLEVVTSDNLYLVRLEIELESMGKLINE